MKGPPAPDPESKPDQGPDGLTFSQIAHPVPGGIAWHVWRGSRYLGRVIDRTPYPRDERVDPNLYAFHPQASIRGTFDDEGPCYSSLNDAMTFFM